MGLGRLEIFEPVVFIAVGVYFCCLSSDVRYQWE